MNCKELFEIFDKIGGEFVINYKYNTGTLLPQNIKCGNLDHAKEQLGSFVFELSMYPDIFTETKLSQGEKVEKIHYYQDMSLKELRMTFYHDNDGYKCPGEKK